MEYLRLIYTDYLFSPDPEVYRAHVRLFHFFPVVCILQSAITTPMGKTSVKSFLNLPGKLSWILMELISPISFFLTFYLNNSQSPLETLAALPISHKILSILYLIHYLNRALISPLRAPAYAPAHIIVLLVATYFNYLNGYSLSSFLLLQQGKVPQAEGGGGGWWVVRFGVGVVMWVVGFLGNIWHEDVLYEIRRRAKREHLESAKAKKEDGLGEGVERVLVADAGRLVVRAENSGHVYEIPEGGLWEYCWHPHYFMEWIEWTGFLIAAGGWECAPAINFLVNEIASMTPRAFQGVEFYKRKFGKKLPERKAVVPFLL
ncbi:hypothetical protein TWF106_005350 [Orbilia oligospora]|uniref:3-oxo-5-alpha-steroid 4-dehydrogenase C-terminal domain-containing protein n=1 Tax=Orbilia oligospora TaxID=2813651 RepID=A0A7C8V2I1_ORBOL|nr:hypothetical protein TWF106_005350 [Orbilia oligospora]